MLHLSSGLTAYILFLAALLGAAMGSFLNCMGWRLVHGEKLNGRSHCDVCGHVLGARDLVPIFSYLASKGRCRYCGKKLSARHVWGELVSALVFVSAVLKFDVSLQVLEALLWASLLLACSFTDLEGYIIPDGFIIAMIALRLVFIALGGNFLPELVSALIGGFAVAGGLMLVVLLYEKLSGKEAMGGGDIKLLFATGLFLGWKCNFLCLILSCFIGILFGLISQRRNGGESGKAFPFGPSIALSAWLCYLWGEQAIAAYMSLF